MKILGSDFVAYPVSDLDAQWPRYRMKFYIAAHVGETDRVKELQALLVERGHTVAPAKPPRTWLEPNHHDHCTRP